LGGVHGHTYCQRVGSVLSTASLHPTYSHGNREGEAHREVRCGEDRIRDAGGPKFVTQNATVLDWPPSPGGEFRVLRAGNHQWTCLPGGPEGSHDRPGCFDQVFLEFMKDSIAGRPPNVKSGGISYMYGGFWVPNQSHAMGSSNEIPRWATHHDHRDGLMQTLNQDGSNGEPYANHLPGHSALYLVVPIREREDSPAVSNNGAKRYRGK
jgi:hypothetical protein